jgi:hypothetical protein
MWRARAESNFLMLAEEKKIKMRGHKSTQNKISHGCGQKRGLRCAAIMNKRTTELKNRNVCLEAHKVACKSYHVAMLSN